MYAALHYPTIRYKKLSNLTGKKLMITKDFNEMICGMTNNTVKELHFNKKNPFTLVQFKAFCKSLAKNVSVQQLTFEHIVISAKAACFFAQELQQNTKLQALFFFKTEFEKNAIKFLMNALPCSSVTELHLVRIRLQLDDIKEVAQMLKIPSAHLRELQLVGNNLNSESITFIAEALTHNTTLQVLNLIDNIKQADEAIMLINAVKYNKVLHSLYLDADASIEPFLNLEFVTAGIACLQTNTTLHTISNTPLTEIFHKDVDKLSINLLKMCLEKNLVEDSNYASSAVAIDRSVNLLDTSVSPVELMYLWDNLPAHNLQGNRVESPEPEESTASNKNLKA